jgi:hypothetical protein
LHSDPYIRIFGVAGAGRGKMEFRKEMRGVVLKGEFFMEIFLIFNLTILL